MAGTDARSSQCRPGTRQVRTRFSTLGSRRCNGLHLRMRGASHGIPGHMAGFSKKIRCVQVASRQTASTLPRTALCHAQQTIHPGSQARFASRVRPRPEYPYAGYPRTSQFSLEEHLAALLRSTHIPLGTACRRTVLGWGTGPRSSDRSGLAQPRTRRCEGPLNRRCQSTGCGACFALRHEASSAV